jgi:methyltransferase-like protein/2-polyprenyl-3-methyl-5-hydroxy-6-metoxy-1,4-benzoquinol methylase
MTTTVAQAYEELAYPGVALPQMHPSRLAAVALLFDLHTAPVERCRVLELGCGEGASLIPMAFELPQSRFLGIDLTDAAIRDASATAATLGLTNIEFRCMDILEAGAALGEFDYIISHGVFTWVPEAVREKLLALCRELLAPNGVAYVSYNARPGGDLRMMLRDMMLYHIPAEGPPLERVRQARALVEMMAEAKGGNEFYQQLTQWQRERIERLPDALLFHDDLGVAHQPFFFHEFMARAERHGLQYLGEADFFAMSDLRLPPAVREKLAQVPSIVAREQYMDFLTGRTFRQTLLCHAQVRLDRNVQPERLATLCFASPAEPANKQPSIASDAVEEFHVGENVTVKTPHRLAKAIFAELGEAWPADVRFEELRARVSQLIGETAARDLGEGLLQVVATRPVITFGSRPHPCAAASERPRLSPIARIQLEAGRPTVTSLRHFSVEARDPLFRAVLSLLDGQRDRAAIADALAEAVESGKVPAPPVGAGGDARPLREQIAEGIERNLRDIARMALLIA